MSAGLHPTITSDLASATIGDLHRTARARARSASARRPRTTRDDAGTRAG